MKIKEVSSKAEKLIEVGKEVEARRNRAISNVQSAQQRVSSAQYALDRASETDENGDTVGDVGAAQADLDAAYMDLEYYEEELDAAEAELESINAEKHETIHTLDEYNEGESGNLSIIKQLQAKTFGGNVAAMAAAIIGQMNLAESTKSDLYKSMGINYSAQNIGNGGRTSGSGLNSSGSVEQKRNTKEQQRIADECAQKYNAEKNPYQVAIKKGVVGIQRTTNGGVSFANTGKIYVHNGKKCIVSIQATGNRDKDFDLANKKMGLLREPDGYVWHHVDDYNVENNTLTLELVDETTHKKTLAHAGSCAQYDAVHGPTYNKKGRK